MRASIVWGIVVSAGMALCLPDTASAGFGRSGGGRGGGGHSSGGRGGGGGGRSSASRATVHTRGGSSSNGNVSPRSERDARIGGYSGGRSTTYGSSRPWVWGPGYHVWGYGFAVLSPPLPPPPAVYVDSPPLDPNAPAPEPPPAQASLGGDLTLGGPGPVLGAHLAIEGERFGFVFAYAAALASIPESDAYDTLHLAQGHLTYALLRGPRGRLRAELGAHLAVAPEVTFLAPGAGLSAVLGLVGPIGMEGRVYGNFWPYTQVDARAGLPVSDATWGISLGARALYLNDNGALGAANAGDTDDLWFGPYVSVAVALL